MKNFSSLHFFSIDKNPLEIDYPSYNSTKTSARNPFVEAEFLYKISHTPKKENHTINNFYMNKGVKKGYVKELRQRDKILSFKLMNFYSKNDVDRLLNGRSPLEDKFLKSN